MPSRVILAAFALALLAAPPLAAQPAFVRSWGGTGTGPGQFQDPYGVAVDGNGNVFVAEYNGRRIQKFAADGSFVTQWGNQTPSSPVPTAANCVAVDGNGRVYVTSHDAGIAVRVFDNDGNYVTEWGADSNGFGIAIDHDGNAYVFSGVGRIRKFANNGSLLAEWTAPVSTDLGWLAVDAASNVYVSAPDAAHRVLKYTNSGSFVGEVGTAQLTGPAGVAVDGDGNIYVADNGGYRVQVFSNGGAFLTEWGGQGSGDGQFESAVAIAVSPSGSVYVTEDVANRIQEFGRAVSVEYGSWSRVKTLYR